MFVACFHLQGFPSYSDVRLRYPASPYVEKQILLHRSDPATQTIAVSVVRKASWSKNNLISGPDDKRSKPSKAIVKS
ncbi:hypothetical protein M404DRAFT_1008983 [Pisolithus tinctorius Marx 270]|uniref:Uncharacterized protein n=1 Tax=Pisolithus tinctorius Marx 270 TaxID=870435 RepID=A0A0C3NC51_PISTI|nr:hypothetical protein M404DRAFT_1008983 [Pisolithus tinctorius Marx 270]